jgi:hypothetical protein
MAGVRIGNSEVSITYADREGREGRTRYHYDIDTPGAHVESDDVQSGCCGGDLRSGLACVLDFLSAFAEAVQYERGGRKSETSDLFPACLREWADQNSDEIAILAMEVDESPDCIVE